MCFTSSLLTKQKNEKARKEKVCPPMDGLGLSVLERTRHNWFLD